MALRELQTALGTLVVLRASGARLVPGESAALQDVPLTAEERAWLDQFVYFLSGAQIATIPLIRGCAALGSNIDAAR